MTKHRIHPVDIHVGQRIRLARVSKGMSQTALAEAVGVTFQQVQKYEKGTNRTSASRLFQFAGVLDVDISYFFDGAGERASRRTPAGFDDLDVGRIDFEILRGLSKIRDGAVKRRLRNLIDEMQSSR